MSSGKAVEEVHEENPIKAEPQPVTRKGSPAVVATNSVRAVPIEQRVRQRERESERSKDTSQSVVHRSSKIITTTAERTSPR